MATIQEARQKLHEVNLIRTAEHTLGLDEFQRGQLAGVQQALAWLANGMMEPVRAVLSDAQLDQVAALLASRGVVLHPPQEVR